MTLRRRFPRAAARLGAVSLCVSLAVALAAGLCPRPAAAAAPGTRRAEAVTLNLPDVAVEAATRAIAGMLGRPIVLDPRVKGRLSLTADDPVTPAQAYRLYLAAIRGLGYAAVESAGLVKIVPEAEAHFQDGPVSVAGDGRGAPRDDTIVTQVFRLTHENATQLANVLRPLISPSNTLTVNPGNNALVITDYAANLRRLAALIVSLDVPGATDVEVLPLQHALASSLAGTVQRLLDTSAAASGSGTSAPGGGTLVLPAPDSNALIVRAAHPAQLAAVRALVARLDLASQAGSGAGHRAVRVVYLKHAEATRLATVLRAAFPAAGESGSSASPSAAGRHSAPVGTAAASGGTAGGSTGSAGASAQATAPVAALSQPATGGTIQADPATNALVITAPEPLWREMRAVIDQLDTRRAQLQVESLVVEVDATRALSVGVKWQELFKLSTTSTLTLGTIAEAIASTAGSNILSTANVLTLDNEEAKIVVGQNVPFVTGSYTSGSTTANPFQTIERKDVGITLRIRPQISENGSIRLTIFQESSSVAATTAAGTSNAGPTTNKRSIETTVLAQDGHIVALGGLLEDRFSADADEVPVLSKLPVLGALFRAHSRTRTKTNLLVFLRPSVLRDEASTTSWSLDRYQVIRAEQQALPVDPREVLLDTPPPRLPEPARSTDGD